MILDVIVCIMKDLCQPLLYLCVILAAGAFLFVLLLSCERFVFRGSKTGQASGETDSRYGISAWRRDPVRISRMLLVVYVLVLLETAFFSREPGSRHSVDLTLFETWGHSAVSHAYFIENIVMYLPFGVLMPCSFLRMKKAGICVMAGFFSSVFLELSQLVTRRGYCQLDDVLTNTAGALIGWLIWRMVIYFSREK